MGPKLEHFTLTTQLPGQWRSKAVTGPGSTVTWGPSIASG